MTLRETAGKRLAGLGDSRITDGKERVVKVLERSKWKQEKGDNHVEMNGLEKWTQFYSLYIYSLYLF